VARRDQVVEVVVALDLVKMINNKAMRERLGPIDQDAAVVTRVGTGADNVEQRDPMSPDGALAAGQWMLGQVDLDVAVMLMHEVTAADEGRGQHHRAPSSGAV
jgi:hypothetical protein